MSLEDAELALIFVDSSFCNLESLAASVKTDAGLEAVKAAQSVLSHDFISTFSNPIAQNLLQSFKFDAQAPEKIYQNVTQQVEEFIKSGPTETDMIERSLLITCLGAAALYAFSQENITGPPLPKDAVTCLVPSVTLSADELQSMGIHALRVDGEDSHSLVIRPHFLLFAKALFEKMGMFKGMKYTCWWQFRTLSAHQRLLIRGSRSITLYNAVVQSLHNLSALLPGCIAVEDSDARVAADILASIEEDRIPSLPAPDIPDVSNEIAQAEAQSQEKENASMESGEGKSTTENSEESVDVVGKALAHKMQLSEEMKRKKVFASVPVHLRKACVLANLEASSSFSWFFDGEGVKRCVEWAEAASGIDIQVTAMMGKRTKFQQDDKSQLIVVARGELSAEGIEKTKDLPKRVSLEEDTSLLEEVHYTDTTPVQMKLHPLDQALLLHRAIVIRKQYLTANDRITAEEMEPFVSRVRREQTDWLIHSMALLLQSRFEADRSRTNMRSVEQLDSIAASYHTAPDSVKPTRSHWSWAIPFPTTWGLQREMGMRYAKLGMLKSAVDALENAALYEDAVDCYRAMGKLNRAETLVRAQLEVKSSPRLWCLLGDVTGDEQWYFKAWEESNHHYARAKRSLGAMALRKKDWKGVIEHYSVALNISALYPEIWFTLGCACMYEDKHEKALNAFTRTVQLDPEAGEAWNNIANLHVKLQNKEKAFYALTQATKVLSTSWRVWQNYVVLAVETWNFLSAVFAMHRLLDLREQEKVVDTEILRVLVKVAFDPSESLRHSLENTSSPVSGANHGLTTPAMAISNPANSSSNPEEQTMTLLQKKVYELLGRIAAQIRTNPDVWDCFAYVQDKLNRPDRVLEYRLKECRSLQKAGWQKEAQAIMALMAGMKRLVYAYLDTEPQDPEAKEKARLYVNNIHARLSVAYDQEPPQQAVDAIQEMLQLLA
eukprot:TRINITY_DN3158_c0_g1::TRINITY_DN3158_c0_g1_i1::g.3580::m.3580 TRINITY_DN3158_c0_g1::TRINITY_DN3158_c0_g1_i1::g.3580  ORF type:complete len:948 (+),score=212.20,sp/Q54BW6/TTC27_DICDI/28.21/1e-84,sp/Q54BW6/TTC27_DICDI/26.84/5e-06,TPR_11/PF13414.1/0.96,TPR_11/PF13414.1/2.1,TPR_11/PF13414.1/0.0042,TPR_11/PF13414.1/1.2e-10,TPR_11/PF13414.1/4.5e+02,TPR_2/PF07719.12/17,TPR_2/PF07719.12/7.9e+02,TPR_2/PF07719.12/1.4e+02,TPR_2/PF07719.12/1.1e-05,TPR_2/PF07719.12/0.061,TPR_1/PF00515.23/2.3e+02,TPR_1/PF0051